MLSNRQSAADIMKTVSLPDHPYPNDTVYISPRIQFGTLDTGMYVLHFSSDTETESRYDWFKVYENTTEGAVLYQRSGMSGTWPDVVV